METFSALLALWVGNSSASGEFPAQKPVSRSFDVFFDLCLNKRLRKQSWGWWFETLSRLLWCHCNAIATWACHKNFGQWERSCIESYAAIGWNAAASDRCSNTGLWLFLRTTKGIPTFSHCWASVRLTGHSAIAYPPTKRVFLTNVRICILVPPINRLF